MAGAGNGDIGEPDRNVMDSSGAADELQQLPIGYAIPLLVFAALVAISSFTRRATRRARSLARVCTWRECWAARHLRRIRRCCASTDPAYSLTIYNTATGSIRDEGRIRMVVDRDRDRHRILRVPVPDVPRQSRNDWRRYSPGAEIG